MKTYEIVTNYYNRKARKNVRFVHATVQAANADEAWERFVHATVQAANADEAWDQKRAIKVNEVETA